MSGSGHDGRALLLIDVFSHFHFKDGAALARAQAGAASGVAAAAAACRREGVCVVYCNDNFGRWQDTWQDVLAYTARRGPPESAAMLKRLYPESGDIVLLKSRHSAFSTPSSPPCSMPCRSGDWRLAAPRRTSAC